MRLRHLSHPRLSAAAAAAAVTLMLGVLLQPVPVTHAQAQGPETAPPRTPRTLAPIELTGTWVSVVTEDWRWRMVTPSKGDFASIPLNDEGRRIADSWDPAKDTAESNACKAYGAGAIMRVPGRIRISWQGDNTLKMETDAGQQTRLFNFGDSAQPPATGDAGWQGFSAATWEYAGGFNPNAPRGGGGALGPAGGGGGGGAPAGGGGRGAGGRGAPAPNGGWLKVVTTKMKAGYLRKNGVPYSETATVTEYYDRHREGNGDEWLTVTVLVTDTKYLTGDFTTSSHFKKETNDAKWRPTPCTAQ